MTDNIDPNIITPAIKNEFEAELRDIQGYLSIMQGAEESLKDITSEAKKKYGITPAEMTGIAKKLMSGKLSEGIKKTSKLLDWMEVAKES